MAARRMNHEDWAPVPRIHTYRKANWEPRDERTRFLSGSFRDQPSPIITRKPKAQPTLEAALVAVPRPSIDRCESPREPEVVDLVAPNTWPRRGTASRGPPSRYTGSPSVYSRCSTRQSEISFGILDYYTRGPSPPQSPDMVPPTPKIDPAMEKFNFELTPESVLPPQTPIQTRAAPEAKQRPADATSGAERLIDITPPSARPEHKRTYSLFPQVEDRPVILHAAGNSVDNGSPAQRSAVPPPNPSYRPRKESVTSSRKDSFTSYRSNRRIPLRILSSSSTATTSPPEQRSRWSDETITSPTVASVARTSVGSRTGYGGSGQYPACFFEDDDDDDEGAPLRWRKGAERPRTFGTVLRTWLLCGCGGA